MARTKQTSLKSKLDFDRMEIALLRCNELCR